MGESAFAPSPMIVLFAVWHSRFPSTPEQGRCDVGGCGINIVQNNDAEKYAREMIQQSSEKRKEKKREPVILDRGK